MGQSKYSKLAVLGAFFFFITTILGIWRNFSPVPFWDMWDGLAWFLDLKNGGISSFWSQHNEHRILLSRILFGVDFKFFGGLGVFLIALNVLFAVAFASALIAFGLFGPLRNSAKTTKITFSTFTFAAALFWSQNNNFTWSFQSQFFLAYLLPFLSLALLGRAKTSNIASKSYFVSVLIALLCPWTLAGGFITFIPFLIIAWLKKTNIILLGTTLILFAGEIFLYFLDYHQPEFHTSPLTSILTQPIQTMAFASLAAGSPFYFIFGQNIGAAWIAGIVGAGIYGSFTFYAFLVLLKKVKFEPQSWPFIGFISYCLATILATAAGRLNFGFEMALSSRYTTPAMYMIAALALIVLTKVRSSDLRLVESAIVALLVGMVPFQLMAIVDKNDQIFHRQVAALGLALGINDPPYAGTIYPNWDTPAKTVELVRTGGTTVFSRSPLLDPYNSKSINAPQNCELHVDQIESVSSSETRITGRINNFDSDSNYVLVTFEHSKLYAALDNLNARQLWKNSDSGTALVGYVKNSSKAEILKKLSDDNGVKYECSKLGY